MRKILIGLFFICSFNLFSTAPNLTNKERTSPPPKVIRTCCAFGSDLSVARIPFVRKTDITSIENVGRHHYLGSNEEGNGIVYTKKGGFLDLGHLRDYADWTAFLYITVKDAADNGVDVELNLGTEGGQKKLLVYDPSQFSNDELFELAGRIAYDLSVWHEIATWFGASYIPLVPERYSSFSPEDLYSNLLGITLGIQALKSELEFDEAMTILLADKMDKLGVVQTAKETYDAMEQVKDVWWTRDKPLPSRKILIRKYLDSEFDLTPWLVPNDELYQIPYVIVKPDKKYSDFFEIKIHLTRRFIPMTHASTFVDRTISQKDFMWINNYIENYERILDLKIDQKL